MKPLISENSLGQDSNIELNNLSDGQNEATAFNEFFTGVGKALQKDIPDLTELEKKRLKNCIPLQWKQAVVTSVYKAGCPGTAGNYKQILTLPITAKILEKCILTIKYIFRK